MQVQAREIQVALDQPARSHLEARGRPGRAGDLPAIHAVSVRRGLRRIGEFTRQRLDRALDRHRLRRAGAIDQLVGVAANVGHSLVQQPVSDLQRRDSVLRSLSTRIDAKFDRMGRYRLPCLPVNGTIASPR